MAIAKLPSQMNVGELLETKKILKESLLFTADKDRYERALRWLELIEDELVLRGVISYTQKEF